MNIIKDLEEVDELYIFSKEHTHHYITAYRMFLDNKILGVGVKNFRKLCSDEKYEISSSSCAPHIEDLHTNIN